MSNRKKGFTLVELLIVIVVIGVLSAMMMLSSTEAVSSAKAAKVIADLTNLKKALAVWYADNYDKIQHDSSSKFAGMVLAPNNNGKEENGGWNPIQETNIMDEISRHIEGASINKGERKADKEMAEGSYGVFDGGKKKNWAGLPSNVQQGRLAWFVGYRFTSSERDRLYEKLKTKEKSLGLVFAGKYPNTAWGSDNNCYTVWMRVI